jgi:hypothetical protein
MRIVDPINLGMWLFYFKESTMKKVDTHFLDYRNLRCNKDPESIFLSVHRKLRKPAVRKVPSTLNFSLTALRCFARLFDRCRFVRAHTDPGAARPEPVIQTFAVGRSAPTGFLEIAFGGSPT